MIASLYEWLGEIEDNLSRMIRGVLRFTIEGLPRWIRHVIMETLGPVALRMCRVLALFCLWLVLLIFPLTGAIGLEMPSFFVYVSLAWLGLAIAGSFWGLKHLARKRKAALARIENNEGLFQGRIVPAANPSNELAFS